MLRAFGTKKSDVPCEFQDMSILHVIIFFSRLMPLKVKCNLIYTWCFRTKLFCVLHGFRSCSTLSQRIGN